MPVHPDSYACEHRGKPSLQTTTRSQVWSPRRGRCRRPGKPCSTAAPPRCHAARSPATRATPAESKSSAAASTVAMPTPRRGSPWTALLLPRRSQSRTRTRSERLWVGKEGEEPALAQARHLRLHNTRVEYGTARAACGGQALTTARVSVAVPGRHRHCRDPGCSMHGQAVPASRGWVRPPRAASPAAGPRAAAWPPRQPRPAAAVPGSDPRHGRPTVRASRIHGRGRRIRAQSTRIWPGSPAELASGLPAPRPAAPRTIPLRRFELHSHNRTRRRAFPLRVAVHHRPHRHHRLKQQGPTWRGRGTSDPRLWGPDLASEGTGSPRLRPSRLPWRRGRAWGRWGKGGEGRGCGAAFLSVTACRRHHSSASSGGGRGGWPVRGRVRRRVSPPSRLGETTRGGCGGHHISILG